MNKRILQESIKRMVKESIDEILGYGKIYEEKEETSDITNKKTYVNSVLKKNDNDKYDHAHLAYQLWPDMDKDSARSLFSKCVRGKRNFSDKDITSLYNFIRTK